MVFFLLKWIFGAIEKKAGERVKFVDKVELIN